MADAPPPQAADDPLAELTAQLESLLAEDPADAPASDSRSSDPVEAEDQAVGTEAEPGEALDVKDEHGEQDEHDEFESPQAMGLDLAAVSDDEPADIASPGEPGALADELIDEDVDRDIAAAITAAEGERPEPRSPRPDAFETDHKDEGTFESPDAVTGGPAEATPEAARGPDRALSDPADALTDQWPFNEDDNDSDAALAGSASPGEGGSEVDDPLKAQLAELLDGVSETRLGEAEGTVEPPDADREPSADTVDEADAAVASLQAELERLLKEETGGTGVEPEGPDDPEASAAAGSGPASESGREPASGSEDDDEIAAMLAGSGLADIDQTLAQRAEVSIEGDFETPDEVHEAESDDSVDALSMLTANAIRVAQSSEDLEPSKGDEDDADIEAGRRPNDGVDAVDAVEASGEQSADEDGFESPDEVLASGSGDKEDDSTGQGDAEEGSTSGEVAAELDAEARLGGSGKADAADRPGAGGRAKSGTGVRARKPAAKRQAPAADPAPQEDGPDDASASGSGGRSASALAMLHRAEAVARTGCAVVNRPAYRLGPSGMDTLGWVALAVAIPSLVFALVAILT